MHGAQLTGYGDVDELIYHHDFLVPEPAAGVVRGRCRLPAR